MLDDDRGDGSAPYRASGARTSGVGTFGARAPGGARAAGPRTSGGPRTSAGLRDSGGTRDSDGARASGGVPAHRRAAGEALYGAALDLRHRLDGHQALLPDRSIAEQELATLMVRAVAVSWGRGPLDGRDEPVTADGLRHCLLLLAAALGSVSALAEPLDAVRGAVERTIAGLDAPP